MVVMRAMGVESDQEAVALVGREPQFANLLMPTMQHCAEEEICTQQGALEYLGTR